MRFGLIYKQSFARSESMLIDADSLESVFTQTMDLDPETFWVEHLIDFENQTVTRAALTSERRLIEVPEGDFGEATPAEYFEQMAVEEEA